MSTPCAASTAGFRGGAPTPVLWSPMDFAFYDLETSGVSPAFDQPLQFAAVRVDGNFAERERVDIRCRLAPHVIPSPEALAVIGIGPERILDPALPMPFDFAREVATVVEGWAPAVWLGYNSIRFDEEFLRQTFYQNLVPDVYATQYNGNMRFDALSAVYAAHVRNPALLEWPRDGDGRPNFRLDRLAPANGLAAHAAHDALGDVEATIHLARRIVEGDPGLWRELVANADRRTVMEKLESFRPLELVFRPGDGPPRAVAGCFCGFAPGYPARVGFFDLEAGDPADFLDADADRLFGAAGGAPRVVRTFTTNRAPALLEIRDPDPELLRRAAAVGEAPEFRERVGRALDDRFSADRDAGNAPVEKRIHDGFYSGNDKQILREFQRANWFMRQKLAAGFEDVRLRQLARRLIAFYSPLLLEGRDRERYGRFVRDRWNAPDSSETEWMSLPKARRELDALRSGGAVDAEFLRNVEAFLDSRDVVLAAGAPGG